MADVLVGFPDWILALGALVCAFGLVSVGLARRAHFVIHYAPGRDVRVRGRIPLSKVGSIKGFFSRDLGASRAVCVRGQFGPGRALTLRFSGPLSPGQKQRVRNFLVDQLR